MELSLGVTIACIGVLGTAIGAIINGVSTHLASRNDELISRLKDDCSELEERLNLMYLDWITLRDLEDHYCKELVAHGIKDTDRSAMLYVRNNLENPRPMTRSEARDIGFYKRLRKKR